ncbi:hypothetical protein [uncultured Brevundimonas sp.]|mgnify:CR=1 FL=1|uniref:hypothetical protein n=1 Tax=uncultured Brevundimonas sp. TaxID=213418 RepID=UPI002613B2E6|nr:hypothetical protein [uncultured Brevundimonas sp.]
MTDAPPTAAARLSSMAELIEQGYDPTPAFMQAYGPAPDQSWNDKLLRFAEDLKAAGMLAGTDAIESAVNAALDRAAEAVADHQREGREWVKDSLWDDITRQAAGRIRALKLPAPPADGGA